MKGFCKRLLVFQRVAVLMLQGMFLSQCAIELKAPPITFTQTQTASEKQMVGEDRDIEKDGWLISSIKSSSSGSELWQRDSNDSGHSDKDYVFLLKKHAYLNPELLEYRMRGILGESYDGRVKRNKSFALPPGITESAIQDFADRVNETRVQIWDLQVKKELEKNPKLDAKQLRLSFQQYYFLGAEYGEFREVSANRWEKKE